MKNLLAKYANVIHFFVENPIKKDSRNDFQRYTYASTENVLHAVNTILHQNNLVMKLVDFEINIEKTQAISSYSKTNKISKNGEPTEQLNEFIVYSMRYQLYDLDSGLSMDFLVDVPFDNTQDNYTKGFGSTSTYAQRYVFGEIFHLGFNEDSPDCSRNNPKTEHSNYEKTFPEKAKKTPTPNLTNLISEEQRKNLTKLATEAGIQPADMTKFLAQKYNCAKSTLLKKEQYEELSNIIQDKKFEEIYMEIFDRETIIL